MHAPCTATCYEKRYMYALNQRLLRAHTSALSRTIGCSRMLITTATSPHPAKQTRLGAACMQTVLACSSCAHTYFSSHAFFALKHHWCVCTFDHLVRTKRSCRQIEWDRERLAWVCMRRQSDLTWSTSQTS
eukprot:2267294-Pleurochrysis_carterae.AAC.2